MARSLGRAQTDAEIVFERVLRGDSVRAISRDLKHSQAWVWEVLASRDYAAISATIRQAGSLVLGSMGAAYVQEAMAVALELARDRNLPARERLAAIERIQRTYDGLIDPAGVEDRPYDRKSPMDAAVERAAKALPQQTKVKN